jgi:hypothetical protein
MNAIKRVDVFENLYIKDSTNIDISNLAKLLGVSQQTLTAAFDVSPTHASRKGIDANNHVMKQWMRIFNLVVDLIEESDPSLAKETIQIKMSRWLRLPNSHFNGESLLDVMMKGRARKVIHLLEQLNS